MTKPLFSNRTMRTLRKVVASANVNFGIGGETWAVERWSGDGTSAAKVAEDVADFSGALAQERTAAPASTLPGGQSTLSAPWQFTVYSGTPQPGDVVTSADDPTIRARLTGLIDTVIWPVWEATRL